ncbi:MAG: hypothetical protein J6Q42_00115, partial [Clostridia bacterium]|nr:hypothetical protein [Clostridia bacterium]
MTVPFGISVTLNLNGHVIEGNGSGAVILCEGSLSVRDSNPTAIHKYSVHDTGLYKWNETKGNITLNGGAITGGASGGIYNSAGFVTIEGGNIVGNYTAGSGGGIINYGGELTINDGNIVGNFAEASGGGIMNCDQTALLEIRGGVIADNRSRGAGNSICNGINSYSTSTSSTIIKGGAIKDSVVCNSGTITISGGYYGSEAKNSIDASWLNSVDWGNNSGTDTRYPKNDYPHFAEPYKYVLVTPRSGNQFYISNMEDFTAMDNNNATYKLIRNTHLATDELVVPAGITVTLDLNGFALKGNGNGGIINNYGRLTIIDGNPDAVHKFTVSADGVYVNDDANGKITINGGVITGGNNGGDGGGINNSGTLTMNSGNIVGNYSFGNGGGVNSSGTFNVTATGSGSIRGNYSSGNGGGINNRGTLNLNGNINIEN